jgi:hypothetical protein
MSVLNLYPTVRPTLSFDFVNAGVLDPSVTFTRPTSATYFDETGILRVANPNTPRFDFNPSTLAAQGFLIEESRTNSIRNNTMVGAVAGTPGTLPTNWSRSASPTSGISNEIVGTGTESGVTYIDLRFTGTATATFSFNIAFETTTQVAASPSQTWAVSTYVKLTAGVLNSATFSFTVGEYSSVPAFLRNNFSSTTTPTSAGLATQRVAYLFTTGASTASIQPQISVNLTNGLTYDFTLRIGLPQLEQGAFATSVIPTTTTALTRNADAASMTGTNFSSWFSNSQGTVYSESAVYAAAVKTQGVWELSGGTTTTSLRSPQLTVDRLRAVVGGTFSGAGTGAVISNNTFIKAAVAWQGLSGRLQSGSTGEDVTGAVNLDATQLIIGGLGSAGSTPLNGTIRRITYYAVRATNAQLQALTA